VSKGELNKLLIDEIDEQEDIEIEMNMLRERAKKADTVTDEMWQQIRQEHRVLVDEYKVKLAI
jgi:proteasome assembly chaperone (PAC2) family protein